MNKKSTYSINENFFKTWDNQMSYILGFCFADGSLCENSLSIKIRKGDRELLQKINTAMNSTYPIKSNKNAVRLRISNPVIIRDLKNLGLKGTKSKRKFPDVPDEFLSSFLRGFFDGDGWISVRKNRKEICIGCVSCDYEFLKKLVKRINDKLNLSVNNLRPRKYKTKKGKISVLYQIDWYSENALNIIRFLYDTLDSNDLYLERKFIKQKIAREIYKKVTKTNTIKNLKGKINMPIKLFLRKCLYEDKLKVSKIAEKLGVSPGTIYEWVKKFRIKLPPRKTVKICPICGKKFKKSNKKYCSLHCAIIGRHTGKIVNCVICGKKIYRPAYWFKTNTNPLCSTKCHGKLKKILLQKRIVRRDKNGRFVAYNSRGLDERE
jgi:hypothetical protein